MAKKDDTDIASFIWSVIFEFNGDMTPVFVLTLTIVTAYLTSRAGLDPTQLKHFIGAPIMWCPFKKYIY